MSTPLDDSIAIVSAEQQHMRAVNDCFIYFAALAETRHRGAISELFQCLASDLPTDCDDETALRIHNVITDFIERCPSHPNVGSAFRILLDLHVGSDLKSYLLAKLKFFHAQGDAHTVYQLCTVIEDLSLDVFRDQAGAFIPSRSSNEGAHIKKCAPFVPASLTPCFSWVFSAPFVFNRFSGFRASLNR
jgi:hypothetical protein